MGVTTHTTPTGWPPHRDRDSATAVSDGFDGDGCPRFLTVWVALTDADAANGCLMVLPKGADAGYADWGRSSQPLSTLGALQQVRALPCRTGGVVCFSHRLLHWGGVADEGAPPRISISCAVAKAGFAPPLLRPSPAEDAGTHNF